jgi:hypothetical protein
MDEREFAWGLSHSGHVVRHSCDKHPSQEVRMKYALLIYSTPESHTDLPEEEFSKAMAEYMALSADPHCLASGQLQPVETATTVRVQDGRTLTTDGPFADTKEVFGGYYLIEAEDLDEAIALASRIPAARLGGGVEVRPLVESYATVE